MTSRLETTKGVLWTLVGLALGVTVVRFARGLGPTTGLTDATPWGLWVGFDVMGGVALAAGGFVVAALAHVFHRERYHHAVRPAILTAMLGYGAVVVGLLYDLGLPWNIWHMTVFWNPRSPLFEVGWCVMLYLAVLTLEFAPVVLERTRLQRLYRALLRVQLPLIVVGIAISTLHQSSLGTLILIMPFRVHELWYTPLLPELFFATAICLGLAMAVFESTVTAWLYERPPHTDMIAGLARLAAGALACQLVFRLGDLARTGAIALALDGTREAWLFTVELLLSSLVPLAVFAVPAWRRRPGLVLLGSASCIAGFLLHRINVAGLAHVGITGSHYLPSWTEFAVSVGIVAGASLVFLWVRERFPVEAEPGAPVAPRHLQLFQWPRFRGLRTWLGDPGFAARRVYSLAFTLALAFGLAFTPWQPRLHAEPVSRARGGQVLLLGYPAGTVRFPHDEHVGRIGRESCGVCHHANKPGDTATPCSECHRDLYQATFVFTHARHVEALGGNSSCARCHDAAQPHSAPATRECRGCHPVTPTRWAPTYASGWAPGLRPAAHEACIGCHEAALKTTPGLVLARPDLARCATCHRTAVPHREVVRPDTVASRDVTRR